MRPGTDETASSDEESIGLTASQFRKIIGARNAYVRSLAALLSNKLDLRLENRRTIPLTLLLDNDQPKIGT